MASPWTRGSVRSGVGGMGAGADIAAARPLARTPARAARKAAGPAAGCATGPVGSRQERLLEHGVLHRLRDAELEHALGRDLDGLARLRVATHAGLAGPD